jgi:hypothetical protein
VTRFNSFVVVVVSFMFYNMKTSSFALLVPPDSLLRECDPPTVYPNPYVAAEPDLLFHPHQHENGV